MMNRVPASRVILLSSHSAMQICGDMTGTCLHGVDVICPNGLSAKPSPLSILTCHMQSVSGVFSPTTSSLPRILPSLSALLSISLLDFSSTYRNRLIF